MTKKGRKYQESDQGDGQKPLKLVLKVGSQGSPVPSPSSVGEDDSERKHKHKRKKKQKEKKDRQRRDKAEEEDLESDVEEDASQVTECEARVSDEDSDHPDDPSFTKPRQVTSQSDSLTSSRSLRERKSDSEKRVLNYLLDYLHKILSRKDVNGFFQFPVTDQIAPRYSEIIEKPMDFSTMKTKIEQSQYSNVTQFKHDFRLMLENCMAYNHPDTIFHKEAQRLLNIGLKQLSREKLMSLKRSLPNVSELTDEELGLKDESDEDLLTSVEYKKPRRGHTDKYEALMDDACAEEILAQAQQAASNAAAELQERNPGSKMGYLKNDQRGATYLHILNPDNTGVVSDTERVVNIGGLMEKLKTGTGNLAGFREDKRNKALPLSYLTYGPFSSYAPIYDSTTANLSKHESDLLLLTYGDEAGIQYSQSIEHYVENAGDYAVRMADSLLYILTSGSHVTTKAYFKHKERMEEEKKKQQVTEPQEAETTLSKEESLRSLGKLGIDMSFLDTMGSSADRGSQVIQNQLDKTYELLSDLNATQKHRLSSLPPQHLANVTGPTDQENNIAEEVQGQLTALTKQVKPSDVTSSAQLHSAMGVTSQQQQAADSSGQSTPSSYHDVLQHSDVTQLAAADLPADDQETSDDLMVSMAMSAQDNNETTMNQLVNSAPFTGNVTMATYGGSAFNTSNGIDSSETEAAVANILQ